MKNKIFKISLALLSFSVIIGFSGEVQAQRKPSKPKPLTKEEEGTVKGEANDLFKMENYKDALPKYLRLFETNTNSTDYNYKTGICYLRTNVDKAKAADYLEFVSTQKDAPKDILYDLALAYHYNGEHEKAIETFEKFREANNGKVNPKYELEQRIEWCTTAIALEKKPVEASFENLGKGINTNYAEFRAMVTADDSVLVFSSNRKGNTGGMMEGMGEIPTDIYYTTFDSSWQKAKNIGIAVNSENFEESLFLNAAGDKLLVYKETPENEGDIFLAVQKGKSFQKAVLVGQAFKTGERETGACLSPDGKTLYFSSDKKGGLGGKDIYRCEFTGGTWGKPENLGEPINTKYDEDNPYMFVDGQTLFFTSNGHKSMGGYDIFKTTSYDGRERWSQPENIGYPLNSVYDDMTITLTPDAKTAYMSAVREGGFGDMDIYKVTFKTPVMESKLVVVKGVVLMLSGAPAKNQDVVITKKSTGTDVGEVVTNGSTGKFLATLLPGDYHIKIITDKQGKVDEDFTVPADGSQLLEITFKCQ